MNMKTFCVLASAAVPLFMLHYLAVSCDRLGEEDAGQTGRLCVRFDPDYPLTRSGPDLPDTCDFRLAIIDSKGRSVYDGAYGDCPESLDLPPGSYTVKAASREFVKPAFEAPQFGDEQCVVVTSGGSADVRLVCSQLNAGISLDISGEFLVSCPNSVLFLKSSAGKIMYSYTEKRTAYFPPGSVSLVMNTDDKDEVIFSRILEPRDMVVIKVTALKESGVSHKGISMTIDTTRVWSGEQCVIGGESQESDGVITVAQAMNSAGREDVWVSGYIVGGDLTSASASFEPPFKSRTNLLLGPRSSTVDKSACISVQLPDGQVRDALNLVDNEEKLRKRVQLRGDLVGAYFGIPGMKNTSEYQFL